MKIQEVIEVGRCLFENIIIRYGCLKFFVLDRGKLFMNNFILYFCDIFDIKYFLILSYYF